MIKTNLNYTVIVIYLCLANALIRPVAETIHINGFVTSLADSFGINPVVWLSIALASICFIRGKNYCPDDNFYLLTIALAVVMVPIATTSWLSLFAVSLLLIKKSHDCHIISGASIMALIAIRDPLLTNISHLFNSEILAIDAGLVTMFLNIFDQSFIREGNLIIKGDNVSLIIMKGCSSLSNLSYSFLIWYSITRYLATNFKNKSIYSLLIILFFVFSLNIVRLSFMALNKDYYLLLHSSFYIEALSIFSLVIVILLSIWGTGRWKGNSS